MESEKNTWSGHTLTMVEEAKSILVLWGFSHADELRRRPSL